MKIGIPSRQKPSSSVAGDATSSERVLHPGSFDLTVFAGTVTTDGAAIGMVTQNNVSFRFAAEGLSQRSHTIELTVRDEAGNRDEFISSFDVGALCGDLTGDGLVNVFDAIATLQIAAGMMEASEIQTIVGDLNRDSEIDVFDAIAVLQVSVRLILITECGPPA